MDGFIGAVFRQLEGVPMVIVIAIGMWFFLKELKKNQEGLSQKFHEHEQRISSTVQLMKEEFHQELTRLKEHSDAIDEKHAQMLHDLHKRILSIETGHMNKEDIYRMMGGWRSDVDRLSQSIERLGDRLYVRNK